MEQPLYGETYMCFYKDQYIGIATYIDDPQIGDSFVKIELHKTRGLQEISIFPDRWLSFSGDEVNYTVK